MTRSAATRLSTAALMASVSAVSIGAITVPTIKFTDAKLKNGLRVIISEDHAAPVFSVAVAYNVGSRDERMGRSRSPRPFRLQCASTASSNSATILVILIIGLTAGPAVSLYGSPTVSPVTAALWASEPLPP